MVQQLVSCVSDVSLTWLKSNPPFLLVGARGFTRKAGWTNVSLVRSDVGLIDGHLVLKLVGDPPQQPGAEVLSPIEALPFDAGNESEKIHTVTVLAAENRLTVTIEGNSTAPNFAPHTPEREVPFPFSSVETTELSQLLRGKRLVVVPHGAVIDQSYQPDRFVVYLDEAGRIARAKIG